MKRVLLRLRDIRLLFHGRSDGLGVSFVLIAIMLAAALALNVNVALSQEAREDAPSGKDTVGESAAAVEQPTSSETEEPSGTADTEPDGQTPESPADGETAAPSGGEEPTEEGKPDEDTPPTGEEGETVEGEEPDGGPEEPDGEDDIEDVEGEDGEEDADDTEVVGEEDAEAPEEAVSSELGPAEVRTDRIEESLKELRAAMSDPADTSKWENSVRSFLRGAKLSLAKRSAELAAAEQLAAELRAQETQLSQLKTRFVRGLITGERTAGEAKTEIKRLTDEQGRYDDLYDKCLKAFRQAEKNREYLENRAKSARQDFSAYVSDALVRETLQRLDQSAVAADKARGYWSDAIDLVSGNAELAAEAIAAIQTAVSTAYQRRLLYRSDTRPSLGAFGAAVADLGVVFAAAWPRDGGVPVSSTVDSTDIEAPAGWLVDMLWIAVAAAGTFAVLALLSHFFRGLWRRGIWPFDPVEPGMEERPALGIRSRLLLLSVRTATAIVVVLFVIRYLALRHQPPLLVSVHWFYVFFASAFLGYAALVTGLRMVPETFWKREANREAWHRISKWMLALAAICVVFLPAISALKGVGYPHLDVVVLLEAVFGLLVAVMLIGLFAKKGAVALLECPGGPADRGDRWAVWLIARAPWVRLFLIGSAFALVTLHLLGWTNLARYFGRGLALTPLLLFVWTLIAEALREWEKRLRTHNGQNTEHGEETEEVPDDYPASRMLWFARWVIYAAVIGCLLWSWGVRGYHISRVLDFVSTSQFSVKGTQVTIASLLRGIALCILLLISGRLTRRLLLGAAILRRFDEGARYAISATVYYLFVTAAVVTGILTAGFELSFLTVFAGVAGVAIGFGSQDIAKNFISGIIILLDRSVNVGDYVILGATEGTITDISMRSTTLRTPNDEIVIVPNATLVTQQIVNATLGNQRMRMVLDVVVASASDPDAVIDVLRNTARAHQYVIEDPGPEVWMSKLVAASLNFQLVVWTDKPEARAQTTGELTSQIWKRLNEQGIALV